eukprot:1175608-Rhodomonas_salina.1
MVLAMNLYISSLSGTDDRPLSYGYGLTIGCGGTDDRLWCYPPYAMVLPTISYGANNDRLWCYPP